MAIFTSYDGSQPWPSRTAQARAEAQEAAAQAARRAQGAREAQEAAQRMALAEMDATGREMEDGDGEDDPRMINECK